MSDPTLRPDRTSMEGMIWNANHILSLAADPKGDGLQKDLFKKAIAVCIVSVVEVGFVFSGNVGTGILIKKNADGSWSTPCAMGCTGVGWGFIAGGHVKEMITFIFDEVTLKGMMGEIGAKIGGQGALSLGPLGRTYDASVGISNKGATGTFTTCYSKGVFGGLSIEGAVLAPRGGVNDSFYGMTTTPQSVLEGGVTMPADKPTLIGDVYDKLAKLSEGQTHEPSAEEAAKVQAAAAAAQQASTELHKSATDVVQVNAAEEAAKEGSS